jgi:transcriptional regulator with XRE-family HTH domain
MQKVNTIKKGRPLGSTSFDPVPAAAFGEVVKFFRLAADLSQEELSHIAMIERSHMGKIERGQHLPNLLLILRLAEALKIKPGKLLDKTVELLSSSD